MRNDAKRSLWRLAGAQVRYWPLADSSAVPPSVRCQAKSGMAHALRHVCFDPKQTRRCFRHQFEPVRC